MIPLASAVECVALGTVATGFTAPALALPAVLGARRVLARRSAAPLARAGMESALVLGAAMLGAAGAVAWSNALGAHLGHGAAAGLLGLFAPAPLAAVPWFAGEILSGASMRQVMSFFAALAACCAVSWTAYAGLERLADGSMRFFAGECAAAAAAGLAAAVAYLSTRGRGRDEFPGEAIALDDSL